MAASSPKISVCPLCKEPKTANELADDALVHDHVIEAIRRQHPDWSPHDQVCLSCLKEFGSAYIQEVIAAERGEISALEAEVVKSLKEGELFSRNIFADFDRRLTFGERISDRVADIGGSWRFIIAFLFLIGVWMVGNTVALLIRPFDPYPFIFLNLILSCIAAIQAPVIMMSQNRQEARDRLRAEHDYQINLKAELEIRALNAKIDQLITRQWQRLLEIQEMQIQKLEELARKSPPESASQQRVADPPTDTANHA